MTPTEWMERYNRAFEEADDAAELWARRLACEAHLRKVALMSPPLPGPKLMEKMAQRLAASYLTPMPTISLEPKINAAGDQW